MKLLKLFTKRNAFSREYGTWLIVLFNFVTVPILMHEITWSIAYLWLSIFAFMMFRFEILDAFSVEIQFSKKGKILWAIFYLIISSLLFGYMIFSGFLSIPLALFICISGISMLAVNIFTRRKKGKRQPVLAQILLVTYISFIGALNYYLLTDRVDAVFFVIFGLSALFYSNSILFVRSKTMGSPFDVYALMFSIMSLLTIAFLSLGGLLKFELMIVLIPTFVKTLDNLILTNTKVPLRRIGINETVHSALFIFLLWSLI